MGMGVSIWLVINLLLLGAGGAATLWLTFWRGGDPSDPPPLALATLGRCDHLLRRGGRPGPRTLRLLPAARRSRRARLCLAERRSLQPAGLGRLAESRTARGVERSCRRAGRRRRPDRAGRPGAVAVKHSQPQLILPAVSRHTEPLPVGAQVIVTALHNGSGGDAVEVAHLPARGDRGDSAVA